MTNKELKRLEEHLRTAFPTSSIHVRPDAKMEFCITGHYIVEIAGVVIAEAEIILRQMGYSEPIWGKPVHVE